MKGFNVPVSGLEHGFSTVRENPGCCFFAYLASCAILRLPLRRGDAVRRDAELIT